MMQEITGNNIGEARRRYAKENGKFTQEDAADTFGVSLATYRNWEQGRTGVSLGQLVRIADKYETTVDYLLARKTDPESEALPKLSLRERELLKTFRQCSEEGKRALEQTARALGGGGATLNEKSDAQSLPRRLA